MNSKFLIVILILVALTGIGQSTIFLGIDTQNFEPTEFYDDDIFIGGEDIRFQAELTGDLTGGSHKLVFTGNCGGNINWGSKTITIAGDVNKSVRAFASNIDINANIGNNLIAAGREVVVGPGSNITRDASLFAGAVKFEGHVGRNLTINAGEIELSGRIDGNVDIEAGKLTIKPNTFIAGNLVYVSPEKAKIPSSVEILGKTEYTESTDTRKETKYRAFEPIVSSIIIFIIGSFAYYLWVLICLLLFNNAGTIILTLLALIVSGLVIINIKKSTAEKSIKVLENRFFTALGLGVLIILLFPFVSLLAFISFVGWPLAFLLLFAFGTFSFAGAMYAAQFLGCAIGRLLNMEKKPLSWVNFIIGLVIIALLALIPVFGWIVVIATIGSGMGALILSLDIFRSKKSEQEVATTNVD